MDAQLLGRRLYETMLVWDTEEFSDPVMVEFAETRAFGATVYLRYRRRGLEHSSNHESDNLIL